MRQPLQPKRKLLDQLSDTIRARRYSPRTEEAYRRWVRRFVVFHGTRHPSELGAAHVNQFLTDLAVEHGASASTQAQARAAILFLYRFVLHQTLEDLAGLSEVVQGKNPKTLPVVLTRVEVSQVLGAVRGLPQLVAFVMYGSGLRLSEALRLRVKDLDLTRRELIVRGGKGGAGSCLRRTGCSRGPPRRADRGSQIAPASRCRCWSWLGLPSGTVCQEVTRVGYGVGLAVRLPFLDRDR